MVLSSRKAAKLPDVEITELSSLSSNGTNTNTNYAVKTTARDPHAANPVRRFSKTREFDPNLPIEELDEPDESNAEKGTETASEVLEDNSPYPEV